MAQVFIFNWIRPGYEIVSAVKLYWKIQVSFLADGNWEIFDDSRLSPMFSSQGNPNSKWQLQVCDENKTIIIRAYHYNLTEEVEKFVEPVLGKLSIVNNRRQKVFQQMVSSAPTTHYVEFHLSKKDLIESKCQRSDGIFSFYCKILTHVKQETEPSADPSSFVIDCSSELMTHLVNLYLYDDMQFSDVNFNIGGREFLAHKNILAARSKYFAAMFKHPTKENSTNQVNIEDIEPEVFDQLLRFIYTGRVPLDKLETMAVGLFIAADKYLMDELKTKCGNYLLNPMSLDNCVVLLLHGDLQNPAKYLKKAANFFRRYPSQVMATNGWKKMKTENPVLLCDIHEFVYRHSKF